MVSFLKNITHSGESASGSIGSAFCNLLSRMGTSKCCPIGIDMGEDTLKLAQLSNGGKGVILVGGGSENRPVDVKPGSGNWQRWAVEAIRKLTSDGRFRGREVVAAMPASEVFIDYIRMPRTNDGSANSKKEVWSPDGKMDGGTFSKIKQKLPFDFENAVIKCVPGEEDNVLVIASERERINRYLAVYEKAELHIKAIDIWPMALINTYTRFFSRRKTDVETIVMLLDMEANCTNAVVCRHKNLLFARSIPIGTKQLDNDDILTRLVLELTACRHHFVTMYRKARIERLIFLSGSKGCGTGRDVCATIAKQLEMPAQMGDCVAAVEIANPERSGVDRRQNQFSWATAFGLSLS